MSLFAPKGTNSNQEARLYGFPISTSVRGKPVPIVYGLERISPNLIWQGAWIAIATSKVGNKAKGGGSSQTYNYYADFMMSLCQGPIQGVGAMWFNNTRFWTSGGGSQAYANAGNAYTIPSGGGTFTPQFADSIFQDLGVYQINDFSVSVNDYGSPGATTLSGSQNIPLVPSTSSTPGAGQYYFNPVTGTYTFAAANAGTTVQIGYVWNPAEVNGISPVNGFGFAALTGDLGQAPWTVLGTPQTYTISKQTFGPYDYRQQQLGYSGVALLAAQATAFGLGTSGVVPNFSFEVFGFGIWGGGIVDAPILVSPSAITQCNFSGGGVASVTVLYSPSYWSTAPAIQIVGNGTGATGHAVINSNGQITGIVVDTPGTGYSSAQVFISPILETAAGGIVTDVLTNPVWGAGMYPFELGDTTNVATYGIANSLFVSLSLESQREAREIVRELLLAWNSEAFWSEGVLKFASYGDTSAIGNGVVFTPNTQPQFDLDVDDFISMNEQGEPLLVAQKSIQDRYNRFIVQWRNRNNDYDSEPCVEDDLSSVTLSTGRLRPAPVLKMDFIKTQPVAQAVANTQLNRSVYIINKYTFKLQVCYCVLEPMDLVTVTDPYLGLVTYPVRILSISETENMEMEIEAEDFPWGTATPTLNPKNVSATFGPGFYADPGTVNPPQFVDLPAAVTQGSPYTIGIALSGPISWGGADVWVSTDGGNSYSNVGRQNGASTMGGLTSVLPSAQDPDDTDTLAVNLLESFGVLPSFTAAEENANVSLIAVDDELLSYRTAALGSEAFDYNITHLRRGAYDSTVGTHAIGAPFCSIYPLDNVFLWEYNESVIGTTVYFKFTSFNQLGGREQNLSDATVIAYPYFVQGPRLPYPWSTSSWSSVALTGEALRFPNFDVQLGTFGFAGGAGQQTFADGSPAPGLQISGLAVVNSFSTISRPPTFTISWADIGGTIPGGVTVVVGVWAQDADGLFTKMTRQSYTVPSGTNTNVLFLSVTFFDPAHDSGWVLITTDPDTGWYGPNATAIPIGMTTYEFTSIGPLWSISIDENFDHFLMQTRTEIHGGVAAGQISAITNGGGQCVLTFTGSSFTTNQFQGRILTLLGRWPPSNALMIDINVPIVSNTADTITIQDLTVTPIYLAVGDLVMIRTRATAFSATTIGDSNFANNLFNTVTYAAIQGVFSTNPSDGETATVAGKVYTFQASLTDVDGNVQIGVTTRGTFLNFISALTLGAGPGSAYAAATTANPNCVAVSWNFITYTVNLNAITAGVGGNGLTCSATAPIAWGNSGVFAGGGGVPNMGLIPNAEVGYLIWIVAGTGTNQPPVTVVSNTNTVYTVTGFAITPDATSMFVVTVPQVDFSQPTQSLTTSTPATQVSFPFVINNVTARTYFVQVLTVDADGNTSVSEYSPFRELYWPGAQGTRTVTASCTMLNTDSVVVFEGITEDAVYTCLPFSQVPNQQFIIARQDCGSFLVTVQATGTDTFASGGNTIVLTDDEVNYQTTFKVPAAP